MTVKDWNKYFTYFVIDSINEIRFPYIGGEKGILSYYNFENSFYTRCWLSRNYLIFQTLLYMDFNDDTEAEAKCISGIEAYIREAFDFEEDKVKLLSYEANKSSYYGGGYKIVLKFKIDKNIQNKLIALAKIKGYKI